MTGILREAKPNPHLNLDRPVRELAHVDYMQLFDSETVGQSLGRIRGEHLSERIVYFYAIGKGDKLVGVVPARRMIVSGEQTLIRDILVSPVISVPEHATLREAFETMAGRKLLAVPLVDSENRISGVIDIRNYSEEALDFERREAAERMFQILGIHIENAQKGIWPSFRSRFPWMLCNIASGLAAAAITGAYSGVLQHTVALAFFFSVVLGIAESVSMQSVSIGLQSLDPTGRCLARSDYGAGAGTRGRNPGRPGRLDRDRNAADRYHSERLDPLWRYRGRLSGAAAAAFGAPLETGPQDRIGSGCAGPDGCVHADRLPAPWRAGCCETYGLYSRDHAKLLL